MDAEVLASRRSRRSIFDADEERDVLETVRASFSAPRKTIRNALSHALGIDSMQTVRALERAAIDPGARAETLGVPDFLRLAHALRVELTGRISLAMPELPEVESLRRILVRTAVGRTIVSARIGENRLRRRVTPDFCGTVTGRRIVELSRRAKYLIVELDGDHVMLVHLGMSGSLTHRQDGFDAAGSIRATTISSFRWTTRRAWFTTIRGASAWCGWLSAPRWRRRRS